MHTKWCFVSLLFLWRSLSLIHACGPKSRPSDQKPSSPQTILFSKPSLVNVLLELRNVPIEATSYEIYNRKKNTDQPPVIVTDGRLPMKDKPGERIILLSFNVSLEKKNEHIIYEVFLQKAESVYCNRGRNEEFLNIIYDNKKQRPVDKTCKITLDWKNQCYETYPDGIGTPRITKIPVNLTIVPKVYKDIGERSVEFKCSAYCYPEEVLVWFQNKGDHDPVVLLVNHTKKEISESEDTRIYTEITLKKTLEDGDRGTTVFCGVRVIDTNTEHEKLNLSLPLYVTSGVTSLNINFTFNRAIENVKPEITVEPGGDVFFEPNSTIVFKCRSIVVDGRTLDWYEEDLDSVSRHLASEQVLDGDTMTSTLKLYVNESYVSRTIYCAQEHRFMYRKRRQTYGVRYGLIARSEPITLTKKESDIRARKLLIAGVCVVGALLLLLVGLLVSWRWRRQPRERDEQEEGDYVVPQVTYAVLELPKTDSRPPTKPEKQNYVEIVGVYKNKTRNK